jgi:hypothetical protein
MLVHNSPIIAKIKQNAIEEANVQLDKFLRVTDVARKEFVIYLFILNSCFLSGTVGSHQTNNEPTPSYTLVSWLCLAKVLTENIHTNDMRLTVVQTNGQSKY